VAKLSAFGAQAMLAAALACLALFAPHSAAAQTAGLGRLPITPAGPLPEPGQYRADDTEFLIDHEGRFARLRFSGSDEIFYLESEPASLGGRVLRYDTGEMALAVTGWGGVTLYTDSAPNGIPAERTGDLADILPRVIPGRETKFFAATLSQRLADRQNLAVGFAADWDVLARNDGLRALAVDSMRNATYALERLSATRPVRAALAARVHVIRVLTGEKGAALQNEVLTVTFRQGGGPSARPSSRAIAEVITDTMSRQADGQGK
jgi:hypothetical protein